MKSKIGAILIALLILLPAAVVVTRKIKEREIGAERKIAVAPKSFIPYTFQITKADPAAKGYFLISPYQLYQWRNGEILIMDMSGKIYVDRHIQGAVYDFRQWRIKGKTYYSYLVNDPNVFHIYDISLAAGHVVILDSALNEIKQVHLLPYGDITTTDNKDLDLHDFIMLSEDHYYTSAIYEKPVHNVPDSLHPSPYIKVGATVIQEVLNGKVIWQWDATRFPEFYGSSRERNRFSDTSHTADYMHFNAMNIDPLDSNLILSFRNTNQVVKINRRSGDIMWRLGGDNSDFAMSDNQKFLRQHDAKFIGGRTLMLLDNGDSILRQTSRVLEFVLDEKNKKITSFKSYNIPEPYTQYMGQVTKEGDNYFIGGGSGNFTLYVNTKTNEKLFEMTGNQSSFRAYRVDSLYGLERKAEGRPQ